MPQPLEVEQKYRVSSHEPLRRLLPELAAVPLPFERHCDTYFRHPDRDFAQTGEAFRIREVNNSAVVTYKGPRLQGTVKIRQEIELPLADGTRDGWFDILHALGFKPTAQVRKTRDGFELIWLKRKLTIALDEVEGLGLFVEIETIVETISEVEAVQTAIHSLAEKLGLTNVERRSYLRQLLDMEGSHDESGGK